MNKLELTLPSTTVHLHEAEKFTESLAEAFEIPQKLRGRLALAIAEAVNNAILHGNKGNPAKQVRLAAVRDGQRITVTVEDEGEGFDFSRIPDPTTPENRIRPTGRGLYLMATLTDELQFAQGGAKAVMTFFLNQYNQ